MQLIIGNKNYSSWSLRPWLLMQYFSVPFSEQHIWLFSDQMSEKMLRHSPSLKVPVLQDEALKIWDSLAICEYVNDQYLENKAWPQAPGTRATARSICAEMHSGFFAIRAEMPMNCRRAPRAIDLSAPAQLEIKRIIAIFNQCLVDNGEENSFLFGEFSIADAFFMPIVIRFTSYQITIPEVVQHYFTKMLALEAYQPWLEQAIAESAVIDDAEI
jgi:glutathione S-transferase